MTVVSEKATRDGTGLVMQTTQAAPPTTTGASATAVLPSPSKGHATCAWCGHAFGSIVELIDHVDQGHVAEWDASIAAARAVTGAAG
jgi:hypothetical protein